LHFALLSINEKVNSKSMGESGLCQAILNWHVPKRKTAFLGSAGLAFDRTVSMSAGVTTPAGAGITVASARGSGNGFPLAVGIKHSQFPLDLFAAALLTFKRGVLLAHGADGFEFLVARLANVFIDGHWVHLVSKELRLFYSQSHCPTLQVKISHQRKFGMTLL